MKVYSVEREVAMHAFRDRGEALARTD